jgi:hypothetical protein
MELGQRLCIVDMFEHMAADHKVVSVVGQRDSFDVERQVRSRSGWPSGLVKAFGPLTRKESR